jgi:hypothetical protein
MADFFTKDNKSINNQDHTKSKNSTVLSKRSLQKHSGESSNSGRKAKEVLRKLTKFTHSKIASVKKTVTGDYYILTGKVKEKETHSRIISEINKNLQLIQTYARVLDEDYSYYFIMHRLLKYLNIKETDTISTTRLHCEKILNHKNYKKESEYLEHFNDKLTEMINFAKLIESHIKELELRYANVKIIDNKENCNKIILILKKFKDTLSQINYHNFIEVCFNFETEIESKKIIQLKPKERNKIAKNTIDSTETSKLLALIKETHHKVTDLTSGRMVCCPGATDDIHTAVMSTYGTLFHTSGH